MNFQFQVDSLQRQLALANSEVDSHQEIEKTLLEERAELQHKVNHLTSTIKQQSQDNEDNKSWMVEQASLKANFLFSFNFYIVIT